MHASARHTVGAFWAGRPLGPFESLCLGSFVRAGYRVLLFTFDDDLVVPSGVERCDARDILPEASLFENVDQPGSFAMFSDLFRYRLLQVADVVWVDADVLCLDRPLPDTPYVFGYEYSGFVNCAVLAAPSGSDFVAHLVERSRAADLRAVVWGDLGPRLLTEAVDLFDLGAAVQPMTTFYPLNSDEMWMLFDPAERDRVDERLVRATTLHLWNEILRRRGAPVKLLRPPRGSWLRRAFDEAGVAFPADAEHDVAWVRSALRGDGPPVARESGMEHDDLVHARDTAIHERDVALRSRDSAVAALEAIEASRSWRSTAWLRALRARAAADRRSRPGPDAAQSSRQ